MRCLRRTAISSILMVALAIADDMVISDTFERRILQEIGARMEQFGQQYLSRIEQLQVSSTRTLTQVEDKLGQLQERARVWDTFQSVITSWTDLLVGTDRKMDLLKEGIERTAELYGSISPYSAVPYQLDQINVKLSRLLAKMPETTGFMVNDFAIKGVMATLRELKKKIEDMNRRRFVVKKVINKDIGLQHGGGGDGSDVQYRDIQDELEEAISSNNMLNAIEVKLDRIEAIIVDRLGVGGGGGGNVRVDARNATASSKTESAQAAGGRHFKETRRRVQGEARGRRGGDRSGGEGARGGAATCDRLLKQWSQMELNFDQFDAVREAVGRVEDVLDYKTSTVDVRLDRLEDLMYRQGTKLDRNDVLVRHNQDSLLVRLGTLIEQTEASETATLTSVGNATHRVVAAIVDLHSRLERTELLLTNVSDATAALNGQVLAVAANSSRSVQRLAEILDNSTAGHLSQIHSALDLLAARPCVVDALPSPLPSPSPPSSSPPQFGLRGCEDLAELGMSSDVRYRFGDAFGPTEGLDYMERYCDMDTDGGGWTIIQRRDDFGTPKLNFSQPWKAYKHGFGDIEGEFWFGNDNIHKLTHEQDVSLRVDLQDFEGNKAFAIYAKFKVSGEEDGYHLQVAGYRGNASDSLTSHNLSQFSTWDVTNDRAPPCCPCANAYGGGWWFNSCFESNLNGEYHTSPRQNDHYHGIIWELWKGDYSLKSSEMKVRSQNYVYEPVRLVPSTSRATDATTQRSATTEAAAVSTTSATEPTTAGGSAPASTTDAPAPTETPSIATTPDDLGIEPLNV